MCKEFVQDCVEVVGFACAQLSYGAGIANSNTAIFVDFNVMLSKLYFVFSYDVLWLELRNAKHLFGSWLIQEPTKGTRLTIGELGVGKGVIANELVHLVFNGETSIFPKGKLHLLRLLCMEGAIHAKRCFSIKNGGRLLSAHMVYFSLKQATCVAW